MNCTHAVLRRCWRNGSLPLNVARNGRVHPVSRRLFSRSRLRSAEQQQPADNPEFESILDGPAHIVRKGQQHGPGLIFLVIIPVAAFALGTWQIQRLQWKTELIAKLEDRIIRDPLPLPPNVDPEAISEFDYRRVYARGHFRHDQEMLIGPRVRDGQSGFMVVTPLEREDGSSTVLVNRGWINKKFQDQKTRPAGLPTGLVTVEGLLREPWKKNMFTPDNKPEKGEFYFPDVKEMAALTGSQPIWIENSLVPDIMKIADFEAHGVPIGRPAEVNLRNNHAQYIFTWYGLAIATSIMLWMVVKRPPSEIARRARVARRF